MVGKDQERLRNVDREIYRERGRLERQKKRSDRNVEYKGIEKVG